jgi:GTPase SAR1 family protein
MSKKDAFMEAFDTELEWEAQVFDFSIVLKILYIFFSGRYTKKSFSSFKDFLGSSLGFSREISDLTAIAKWIISAAQPIMDYFGVGSQVLQIFGCSHPDIRFSTWIEDAQDFVMKSNSEGFYTASKFEELVSLKVRFKALMMNVKSMPEYLTVYNLMNKVFGELSKLECMFNSRGVGSSKIRQEPVCVMFSGQSGIGKTTMIRPLLANILGQLMPETNPNDIGANMNEYLYSRNPCQAYWDGYFGQFCTFIDEFDLVKTDLETKENVKAELINMVNNSPYSLNMAHLENKGNTFFNSKLILCTSNVTSTRQSAMSSVQYPEAVSRRFDFEVNLLVKEKYAKDPKGVTREDRLTWRLDYEKARGVDFWELHDCYLTQHVQRQGQWFQVVKENVSTMELIDAIVSKYHDKRKAMLQSVEQERRQALIGFIKANLKGANSTREVIDFLGDLSTEELSYCCETIGGKVVDNYEDFKNLCNVINMDEETCKNLHSLRDNRKSFEKVLHNYVLTLETECDDKIFALLLTKIRERLHSYIQDPLIGEIDFVELCSQAKRSVVQYIGAAVIKLRDTAAPLLKYLTKSNLSAIIFPAVTISISMLLVKTLWDKYTMPQAQMGVLRENTRNIIQAILQNYYELRLGQNIVAQGFFIKGRAFVFNKHVRDEILARSFEGKVTCRSVKREDSFVLTKEILDHVLYQDEEYVAVYCGDVRTHRDISKFLCTQSMLGSKRGFPVMSFRNGFSTELIMQGQIELTQRFNNNGKAYDVPMSIVTKMPGNRGYCGLPYFYGDCKADNSYFLGIHCAGFGAWGTTYKSMCAVFPDSMIGSWLGQSFFDTTQTFTVVGEAHPKVFMQTRTQIKRSDLHGKWGPAKTKPAHLVPFEKEGEVIKPLHVALAKYDAPQLVYDQELVTACVTSAVNKALSGSRSIDLRCITLDQAVFGDPDIPYLDSIPRNTSPGYPWCTKPVPGKPGKTRFFSGDGLTLEGIHWEDLERSVLQKEQNMLNGLRETFYYTGNLKDERRPIEKVDSGSTRYFAGSNIEYYVLFKKYFGSMSAHIMQNRIFNEVAVGINVYSEEWHTLAQYLSPNGLEAVDKIAGDFKAFDAHEARQVLKEIGDIVISQFSDVEFTNIRQELWRHVYESTHVVGNKLIQWCQSLPSGHPWTTIINCLYNMTLFRMAWVKANDGRLASLLDFSLHVKAIFLGDDNLLSVSGPAMAKFSQNKLTEIFSFFGQQYTAETKAEGDVPDFRKLSEVEFLKRTFRYEPCVGRYVAPLRMETIEEIPYWTKKHDSLEITLTNCERSLYELSLWGKEVFEEKLSRMLPKMKDIGYQPRSEDWLTWLDFVTHLDVPWNK